MKTIISFVVVLQVTIFAYSQDVSQIRINNTLFEIGINNYADDYELIYNKWYQGHLSADNLIVGEDVSWINDFTKNINLFEPAEAKLRFFEIELGEVRVLTVGFCELYYSKDTNKLIGFRLASEYLINNRTVDTITSFYQPYFRTFKPQTILMNEKYDLSNSTKNIVSEYLIYSYLHSQGYLFGGVKIKSISLTADIYKNISDLKQWHVQARREIPRSYFFTIYDKLSLSKIEENRNALELAQQQEQERLKKAKEEKIARELAEQQEREKRIEQERQEREREAEIQRQNELREQERLAKEAVENARLTRLRQLMQEMSYPFNKLDLRTSSGTLNREKFQYFIQLCRYYREFMDGHGQDDAFIAEFRGELGFLMPRMYNNLSSRQKRDFEKEFGQFRW